MDNKHLDLGCGNSPRNPYHASELFGIDLHEENRNNNVQYKKANLSIEKIPFEDNYFDSISAFDFIEHVPRILHFNGKTILPFINLMNEIWRTLKPSGNFYAVTPAFPNPEAFQDPTHVNIITNKTHEYFCSKNCYARNYGFHGEFAEKRVKWVVEKNSHTAEETFRKTLRHIERKFINRRLTHLLWELEAIK